MAKPGLTEAEFRDAMSQIQAVYDSTHDLGNIIGPTYGAAMCDKALKIDRALFTLVLGIEDQAFDYGIQLDRPQPSELKFPAVARQELDGTFPPNTPVNKRHWPPLTAREHHALGLRLKDARNRALHLYVKLANAYPQAAPRKLAARAQKVEKIISSIRNEMDSKAHVDCPTYCDVPPGHDGIGPARSWYYGSSEAH
jgi:hypothetical protein